MSIEKLTEFAAKTGDKNTDDLDLERGFPSRLKPARQWFNWLFNSLTVKINELIDGTSKLSEDKVAYVDIVDDLTSKDKDKPLSANMGRDLEGRKLDKSDLASGDAPIFAARAWCTFNGDGAILGSGNIESVAKLGTGLFKITFKVPMSTNRYAWTGSATSSGGVMQTEAKSVMPRNSGDCTEFSITVQANYGGDNTHGTYDPEMLSVSVFC